MYQHVLLAYDGSVEGARALREGALLARTCRARVTLLSVVPDTTGAIETMEGVGGAAGAQVGDYEDLLKRAIAWLGARGIEAAPRLVVGEPSQTIGAVAGEVGADLVVVGHRRQSLFARWWSGSTQAYLSDHVACSILIARNQVDEDVFGEPAADGAPA